MFNLIQRLFRRLKQYIFYTLYKRSFKSLSSGIFFSTPFRIDGAENISIDNNSFFQKGLWLYSCGVDGIKPTLSIGKGSVFGYNNHITCVREVVIGDFVLTANNVYISDNIHEYEDVTKAILHQPVKFKKAVAIGDGAWIGENVSIVGACVGRNSVIGANSVVTRDIPAYSVAVGVPATIIKKFDFNLQQWVKVAAEK